MPTKRAEFYSAMRQMLGLASNAMFIDMLPIGDIHNVRARILRHGLVVSAFSSLEKYLEARAEILLGDLSNCGIQYGNLSVELKKLISIDVVIGIENKIKFYKDVQKQAFVDGQISMLATYTTARPTYASLGFSPKGSNVYSNDIKTFLSAFSISNPWIEMARIVSIIGSSRIDLKNDFDALSDARNKSAHNPNGNVPTNNLISHIKNVIIIAMAFDVLTFYLSKTFVGGGQILPLVSGFSPRLRYIHEDASGNWLERSTPTSRNVRRYSDEASAVVGAKGRQNVDFVVVRDNQNVPVALA